MPESYVLPEFTRSLRAFAAAPALGTPAHDHIFGPLLAARRAAARVSAPESHVAAFDAERLRRALMEGVAAIAANRCGGDVPTRRALEARLEAAARPALTALDGLAEAARAVRAAPDAARKPAWTRWCDAVRAVFDGYDRLMLDVDRVAPLTARTPIRLGAVPGAKAAT